MNIIAYGSLMEQTSLETTLGRAASLTKITLPGYNRIFNAPFDGYAFLNLQPAVGSYIEAAYFEIGLEEISKFSKREAGADLVEVKQGYFAFAWPDKFIDQLPVQLSYINFCEDGARKLGIYMKKGLISPRTIVDDTLKPLYT